MCFSTIGAWRLAQMCELSAGLLSHALLRQRNR